MTSHAYSADTTIRTLGLMTGSLWVAQLALAAFYGMTAYMHAFMPLEAMVQMGIAWVQTAPAWLVRFIGIAELAGAVGIVVPALTRIQPGLTPLAALGLTTIQALAIPFHIFRGEFAPLPFNLVLVALSLFVLWGRTKRAPIAARATAAG